MIAENKPPYGSSGISNLLFSLLIIVSVQLLVLLCSWRQLLTLNLPELNIYHIARHYSFLNPSTITNT